MGEKKYASLATEDLREASSLADDFDAVIASVAYTKEPPDNYPAEGNPIFADVRFVMDGDGSVEERTFAQKYNLGGKAGDDFTISEDGFGLVPADPDSKVRKGSKWATFVQRMQAEGVPKTLLASGDVSKMVGIRGRWKRVDDEERKFSDDKKRSSKFPQQTLVLKRLYSKFAQDGAVIADGAIPQAASAGNSGTAAAPAGDFDLDGATLELLSAVLQEKGGKIARTALTLPLSQKANANPAYKNYRSDIAKRGTDEAYLKSLVEAGLIKYDPSAKPQVVEAA